MKLTGRDLRENLSKLALYVMMGFILGFLFFYAIFHYYAAPFSGAMPTWLLLVIICLFGMMSGYLFPDIVNVLAMAMLLPILAGMFCFMIFISPLLSPDITGAGLGDSAFILARYMLPNLFMAFPVLLITGFVSMHLFEPEGTGS